jgi:hypothetical protein
MLIVEVAGLAFVFVCFGGFISSSLTLYSCFYLLSSRCSQMVLAFSSKLGVFPNLFNFLLKGNSPASPQAARGIPVLGS